MMNLPLDKVCSLNGGQLARPLFIKSQLKTFVHKCGINPRGEGALIMKINVEVNSYTIFWPLQTLIQLKMNSINFRALTIHAFTTVSHK